MSYKIKTWTIYLRRRRKIKAGPWYYYVGRTANLKTRRWQHQRRFGQACLITVIETVRGTRDQADEREQFWIARYLQRYGNRYERTGWLGESFSKKLSQAAHARWADPTIKAKLASSLRAYWARERAKGSKGRCRNYVRIVTHPNLSRAQQQRWARVKKEGHYKDKE